MVVYLLFFSQHRNIKESSDKYRGNIDYNQLEKTLPLSLIMSHTDIAENTDFLRVMGYVACVLCL